MSDIICLNCGSINEYITTSKGVHLQAHCKVCKTFIQNIAWDVPRLYFGKYSGKSIKDIAILDLEYLKWVLQNCKLSKQLRNKIKRYVP